MAMNRPIPRGSAPDGGRGVGAALGGMKGGKLDPKMLMQLLAMMKANQGGRPGGAAPMPPAGPEGPMPPMPMRR